MHPLITLLALASLWLSAARTIAVEITEGPTVEVKGSTAVVRWTTDVECGTTVKYGLNSNHLNHEETGSVGLKHEVKLKSLTDGKMYYFSAGTAKKSLMVGKFPVGVVAEQPAKKEAAPETGAQLKKEQAGAKKEAPLKKEQKADKAPENKPQPRQAPPAKITWGDPASLQDHYMRHGRDFGATSAEDYARRAWEFLQRAMDEGLPAKIDEDGVIRIYEGKTKSFASYNRNGTTKTFFKPQRPDYFKDQPGKLVRLKRPESP